MGRSIGLTTQAAFFYQVSTENDRITGIADTTENTHV